MASSIERTVIKMLFQEMVASIEMGEGLEGYTDNELIEVLEFCERNLQRVAAVDIYGNIVDVPCKDVILCRMVMRHAKKELLARLR